MKVPVLFDTFLSRIEPSAPRRKAAQDAHTTVRERLAADKDLKDIHVDTFLAGSYRRHTAIEPIKDVDIVVILDVHHTGSDHTPQKTLDWLKRALDRHKDYKTDTHPQRRSIRIDLGPISMDVVPAAAPNGPDAELVVPDKEKKAWVATHPKGHIEWATRLNKATQDDPDDEGERGRFVPLVKMIKWWWKHVRPKDTKRPKGFTLECLVGMYHDPHARDWEDVVIRFFDSVTDAYAGFASSRPVPKIPDPGRPGHSLLTGLTSGEFKVFLDAARVALGVAREARDAADAEKSAKLWQQIFGPTFPLPGDDDDGGSAKGTSSKPPSSTSILVGSSRKIKESPPFG